MSVKLRLTRMGNKKRSFFRIVAANSASRRDGRPLEFLGYYNPQVSPADIKIDTDKVQKWMDLGAEMSDTVRSLMKQYAKKPTPSPPFGCPAFQRPGRPLRVGSGRLFFSVDVKRAGSPIFSLPACAAGRRGSASQFRRHVW